MVHRRAAEWPAGAVGGVGYFAATSDDSGGSGAAPIAGERTWSDLGRNHVTGDSAYPMAPPVGGDHDPIWQNCDGTCSGGIIS